MIISILYIFNNHLLFTYLWRKIKEKFKRNQAKNKFHKLEKEKVHKSSLNSIGI